MQSDTVSELKRTVAVPMKQLKPDQEYYLSMRGVHCQLWGFTVNEVVSFREAAGNLDQRKKRSTNRFSPSPVYPPVKDIVNP